MSYNKAAKDIDEAMASMRWSIEPELFALVGFNEPPERADIDAMRPPAQLIREVDETTLLIRERDLAPICERHQAARVESGLMWIRFEAAMGWEVVGFLAQVTGALAQAGVPIGAVCGYSRDHLFVANKYEESTRAVLTSLFPPSDA
ncbi:MAG: hypothetical protein ACI841_002256 [Planctomycetota bacterium]|jgi:hypothetical protein